MHELSAPENCRRVAVGLEKMASLAELRRPEDDWTGLTKAADRRRRQNRLNQRAWRRRKQRLETGKVGTESSPDSKQGFSLDVLRHDELGRGYAALATPQQQATAYEIMQMAYASYIRKAPHLVTLPTLVRLNVLNALVQNGAAIGLTINGICQDDMISPFNHLGPRYPKAYPDLDNLPQQLCPTQLQREILHHPWVDLFPFPRLRDNMLRAIYNETLDEDELCLDLIGVTESDSRGNAYLIVWGHSWEVSGWEATPEFLGKWGFLLKGCPEIMEATNRWRETRGEPKLNIKL